jgi:hypothetical protein
LKIPVKDYPELGNGATISEVYARGAQPQPWRAEFGAGVSLLTYWARKRVKLRIRQ